VVNYPDGHFAVRHEGAALPFREFDKIQMVAPGAIVQNNRLGAAFAFASERQVSYPPNRTGRSMTPSAAKQSGGTGFTDKGRCIAQGSSSSCSRVRPARVSFQLCTRGDISTLRGHGSHKIGVTANPGFPNGVYAASAVRKRPGVTPISRRKIAVRWLWSAKPASCAIQASD
jgi:hypothetical protein